MGRKLPETGKISGMARSTPKLIVTWEESAHTRRNRRLEKSNYCKLQNQNRCTAPYIENEIVVLLVRSSKSVPILHISRKKLKNYRNSEPLYWKPVNSQNRCTESLSVENMARSTSIQNRNRLAVPRFSESLGW